MKSTTKKYIHRANDHGVSTGDTSGTIAKNRAKLVQSKAIELHNYKPTSDSTIGVKSTEIRNLIAPAFTPALTRKERQAAKVQVHHAEPRFSKAELKFIKRHAVSIGQDQTPESYSIANPDNKREKYRFLINWIAKDKSWFVACESSERLGVVAYIQANLSLESAIDDSVTALRELIESHDKSAMFPNQVFNRGDVTVVFRRDTPCKQHGKLSCELCNKTMFNMTLYTGAPTSAGEAPRLNGQIPGIGDGLEDRRLLMERQKAWEYDSNPAFERYCHEHKQLTRGQNAANFYRAQRQAELDKRHAEFVKFCQSWE